MKKIKAGIVGTGFIARAHLEAVRRLGFVEVSGIVGNDRKKTERMAKECHIETVYDSYENMMKDEKIQVIHNCTPNAIHFDVNQKAVQAGKHILSEKPLTRTSEESKRLVEMVKNSGVVHGVNFNYRMYPLVQQMKASIEEGAVGPIHYVHGSYLQDWMLYEDDYDWRVDSKKGGTLRTVGDIGSHWMDLVQYLLNDRIQWVMADSGILHGKRKTPKREYVSVETEDFASLLLRFESGCKGVLSVSQVSAGRKNALSFEMNGKWSSFSWNQERPNECWMGHKEKANEMLLKDPSLLHDKAASFAAYPGGHGEAWGDGIKEMMRVFYRYIQEGKKIEKNPPPFPTFYEGHVMMRVLDAVHQSIKSGKWVRIS